MVMRRHCLALAAFALAPLAFAEDLGAMWGTAAEEAKYYPIVDIPIPSTIPMRPGGLEVLPDGRLAVGTRRGDIYFIEGAFASPQADLPPLRHRPGRDLLLGVARWRDAGDLLQRGPTYP